MSGPPLRIANVGAEENPQALEPRDVPAARRVARLWERLFAGGGAFDWLPGAGVAAAWLNTTAVERAAAQHGAPLFGAPARVVQRVHDKAFAHEFAEKEGLLPTCLRDCVSVLDAYALRDTATGGSALDVTLARWPTWALERFTLKPRFGSSGRGRVAGTDGQLDEPQRVGALPRLAERGGAVCEPWLERTQDLSVQLLVEPGGGIRLLGSLELLTNASGLFRGHAGLVDARGRVSSGSPHDEAAREAAVALAQAAATEGYVGPCGVDAFAFRDPAGEEVLRPVVELNARFTVGTLVLSELRRALPVLREQRGLEPGELRGFRFSLEPGGAETAEGDLEIALGRDDEARRPTLRFPSRP